MTTGVQVSHQVQSCPNSLTLRTVPPHSHLHTRREPSDSLGLRFVISPLPLREKTTGEAKITHDAVVFEALIATLKHNWRLVGPF